jgi:hypothetical protein
MKTIFSLVSVAIVLSQALPGLAITQAPGALNDDFAGITEENIPSGLPGDVTECVGVVEYSTISDKQRKWMIDKGLLAKSAPDQLAFSEKITSRDVQNSRKLLLGCWVFEGRATREVRNDMTYKFVKTTFKINSLIKGSPFMDTGFCAERINPKEYKTYVADRPFTKPRCIVRGGTDPRDYGVFPMSQLVGKTKMTQVQ